MGGSNHSYQGKNCSKSCTTDKRFVRNSLPPPHGLTTRRNGWEFIDGFSFYSAALVRDRWFDHRGLSGDVHTHSHCTSAGGEFGCWERIHLSNGKRAPGCLGCIGDELLPSYMGIIISHDIRIPINQPVYRESILLVIKEVDSFLYFHPAAFVICSQWQWKSETCRLTASNFANQNQLITG